MVKINHPGWREGIPIIAHGVRIGIQVNKPQILERVQNYLPPGWKYSKSRFVERLYSLRVEDTKRLRGANRSHTLYGDLVELASSTNIDEILDRFEADVQFFVAETSRCRFFVHAGVVGWRGKAIVIPGRSFSGKSTLVSELVRAGATYYSDEYALLDLQGRVHPYARPLALRQPGTSKQEKCRVEELGGVSGIKPLPLGVVLVSPYKPTARWAPRRLSLGQGALALLDNLVSIRRQPRQALPVLQRVMIGAVALKGARGEAREVVDLILSSIEEVL